ncbi:MAG TPA: hypothetical protein VFS66_15170 [Acidimicrobiia bacterium]|nr:hypothetical protein [Acidimicrobiia bacterium]
MSSSATNRSISVSLIIGTLLVPISALAAVWLSSARADGETPQTTASAPLDASAPVEVVSTGPPSVVTTPAAADLEAACGPEGMKLVALESTGAITEVQQGALDALRPLCGQQGLALPAAPTPEPIVQTVLAPAVTAAATVTTIDDDRYEDHDDDEYEDYDDDHREHESDDDDHDHDREDDE